MTQPQQQQPRLAVQPGTLAAQRRKELNEGVFIDVRNLAYMLYKNPDQTPLMTYDQTLDYRGMVKQKVMQFEIANGWVVPDGTENQPFPEDNSNQPQNNGAPMNQPPMMPGMPMQQPQQPQQMQMPMQPGYPQQPMPASPMQAAQVPQQMQMPQGMPGLPGVPQMPAYAPPMQQQQMPQGYPQQQQQMPPQQQQQPASPADAAGAAAPTQKRRGRGSQVAAPPPPPPQGMPPPGMPQQQMQQPMQQQMPQGFAPPPGMPMQQQVPVQNFPPQPQQMQQVNAPQAAPAGNLEKLVSDLGRGLEVLSKNNMELKATLDYTLKELADTKLMVAQALGAIHHMYVMSPVGQNAQGKANSLPDFQNFMGQFLGNIGKPGPK